MKQKSAHTLSGNDAFTDDKSVDNSWKHSYSRVALTDSLSLALSVGYTFEFSPLPNYSPSLFIRAALLAFTRSGQGRSKRVCVCVAKRNCDDDGDDECHSKLFMEGKDK